MLLPRPLFPPTLPPSGHPTLIIKILVSSPPSIARQGLLYFKPPRRCSLARSSDTSRYGGWDDPILEASSEHSGTTDAFFGIADTKCAMLFFLGFLSALAVSRVRVWNLAALVFTGSGFACGFLIGAAGIGDSALQMRRTDAEILEEFGTKLSEVKSCLQGFLDPNDPDSGDIRRFLGVVESLDLAATPVRRIVQDSAEKPQSKSSKKKRETAILPYDLLQFLRSSLKEISAPSAFPKRKIESVEKSKAAAENPSENNEEEHLRKKNIESRSSPIENGNGSIHGRERSSNPKPPNAETSSEKSKEKVLIDSSEQLSPEEEEFNSIMMRGTSLLKDAGDCLKRKEDEQTAEIFLYKSSKLLQIAVAMKPLNPLALGHLGNSRLLHGELKLKISRDLRSTLLQKNGSLGRSSFLKKEKMVSALVDVCEECEQLLIDAGRNYKMILSIDDKDVRALYNWGLALSFRAELIADTGPDAAIDADKIYLAAIEKFDAVLSRRESDCSSDALYRWGLMLRRRSQLRPRGSSEKLKLLQQAKTIFEDVLRVDAKNIQVRQALQSCISDLR